MQYLKLQSKKDGSCQCSRTEIVALPNFAINIMKMCSNCKGYYVNTKNACWIFKMKRGEKSMCRIANTQ